MDIVFCWVLIINCTSRRNEILKCCRLHSFLFVRRRWVTRDDCRKGRSDLWVAANQEQCFLFFLTAFPEAISWLSRCNNTMNQLRKIIWRDYCWNDWLLLEEVQPKFFFFFIIQYHSVKIFCSKCLVFKFAQSKSISRLYSISKVLTMWLYFTLLIFIHSHGAYKQLVELK